MTGFVSEQRLPFSTAWQRHPGGHGAALSLNTYGHVFAEFEDVPRMSAEDAIRDARVPRLCPAAPVATATGSPC